MVRKGFSPSLLAGWQDGDKIQAACSDTLVAEGSELYGTSKGDTGSAARARQVAVRAEENTCKTRGNPLS